MRDSEDGGLPPQRNPISESLAAACATADRPKPEPVLIASVDPGRSPYLTVNEIAERYQVPVTTIRYWRLNGLGPKAVKIGRFLRYRIDDVLAWERELAEAGR
jgi:hypothetical protein